VRGRGRAGAGRGQQRPPASHRPRRSITKCSSSPILSVR